MSSNNNMSHVKDAQTLRNELASGKPIAGVYGDTTNGQSFTIEESKALEARSRQARGAESGWYTAFGGANRTKWTIIEC